MGITKTTTYTCSDGKVFTNQELASLHERNLTKEYANKSEKWLKTYSGQKLLEKHSLDEDGIWQIKGEDPNCDLGGYHHQPNLGTVSGVLRDVIDYAVELKDFYTWGGGGDIIKVEIKKV